MRKISEKEIFKEICENDFAFFCKQFVKVVEPETTFEWNWHLDLLCQTCERVYYGELQNIDINIPPRMLKTIIITVLFPCWVWTKQRSKKFLIASSSNGLATRFSIKRRDLIRSDEFRSLWDIEIRDDMDKVNEFANYSGGFMRAVSANGRVTGEGADFIMSDDLLDAMDAFSKAVRESTNLWYSHVFSGRTQNKKTVRRINVNQRLHEKDVSWNLRENHNFDRLIIPMIKMESDDSTIDYIDPRKVGEFIFPARYAKKEMEEDYKSLGVYGWSSQFQQSPRPIGGGIIKDEWIRYYDVLPGEIEKKIITADLSFKGNKDSDYVCFQCWGRIGFNKYLIDIVRGRWSYKETKEKFKAFCAKHNVSTIYIEDKANGPALISDMASEINGLIGWPQKGSKLNAADKVQRLHLCSQDFELGNVYFPKGMEIVKSLVEEITSFTENGSGTGNDDMVDTATMALIELNKAATFVMG